ncbi:uncharacterized protein [Dysidea avara]
MTEILETVLSRLSWPQDANHIVNIRSTLETIKSSLFTSLVELKNVQDLCVDVGDEPKPAEIDLKETSIDDSNDDMTMGHGDTLLCRPLHTPLPHVPENDCVIIDNQVAIETQEDVSHNNTASDEDDSVIKNKQFEGSHPDNGHYSQSAAHRDILFPMRDQKSLEEIKQSLQRRTDTKQHEA